MEYKRMTCLYDCEHCQRKMREEVVQQQLDHLKKAVDQEKRAKLSAQDQLQKLQDELNEMKESQKEGITGPIHWEVNKLTRSRSAENIFEPQDIE